MDGQPGNGSRPPQTPASSPPAPPAPPAPGSAGTFVPPPAPIGATRVPPKYAPPPPSGPEQAATRPSFTWAIGVSAAHGAPSSIGAIHAPPAPSAEQRGQSGDSTQQPTQVLSSMTAGRRHARRTLASYLEPGCYPRALRHRLARSGRPPIALVGDDRRCFVGGTVPPAWLARDAGALIRSRAWRGCSIAVSPLRFSNATATAGGGHCRGRVAWCARLHDRATAPRRRQPTGRSFLRIRCRTAILVARRDQAASEHAAATAPALAIRRRVAMEDRGVQRTRREGLHDSLTGLPNRVLFMERLAQAVARNRREQHPLV